MLNIFTIGNNAKEMVNILILHIEVKKQLLFSIILGHFMSSPEVGRWGNLTTFINLSIQG